MAVTPITDLPSLYLNLSDYMARSDLEEYYPTFVQLAEKRLNSSVKALGMQAGALIDISPDGIAVLPSDYIEWVTARFVPTAGRVLALRFVEPNSPEVTHRHRPNGPPQYYTTSNNSVRVVPGRAGKLDLHYYRRLPPLTDAAPTNWLLTTAPQIYLYATLGEAYVFQKDEVRAGEWLKMSEERLGQFVMESSSGKVGRRAERAAENEAEIIAAKALN